eukprot:CAMPEP_0172866072 /NCGR_PEP_ID=MMETSP1075-20121228/81776_1 /TAXON_ID=2916 /ORGANISM="Ceratium fusus, Strain PA161109" /LENGTH=47 /DNA_ID= /DNA_START= /DNA_END= /DNA_ORIENTATION=
MVALAERRHDLAIIPALPGSSFVPRQRRTKNSITAKFDPAIDSAAIV